jgi:hypothetical protein
MDGTKQPGRLHLELINMLIQVVEVALDYARKARDPAGVAKLESLRERADKFERDLRGLP